MKEVHTQSREVIYSWISISFHVWKKIGVNEIWCFKLTCLVSIWTWKLHLCKQIPRNKDLTELKWLFEPNLITLLEALITTTADDSLKYFFFNFQRKYGLTVHVNWQMSYVKYQVLLSLKNHKINFKVSSAANLLNALRVSNVFTVYIQTDRPEQTLYLFYLFFHFFSPVNPVGSCRA